MPSRGLLCWDIAPSAGQIRGKTELPAATEEMLNTGFLLGCAGFLIYPGANKASTVAQEANGPGEWRWWLLQAGRVGLDGIN